MLAAECAACSETAPQQSTYWWRWNKLSGNNFCRTRSAVTFRHVGQDDDGDWQATSLSSSYSCMCFVPRLSLQPFQSTWDRDTSMRAGTNQWFNQLRGTGARTPTNSVTILGTLEDDRRVLYKTKSLDGTKPDTNPKTTLKLTITLILTLN